MPPPGIAGIANFPRQFGHHCFRCDQEAGDRGCILQRATHDLGRIDDALADKIAVFAVLRVKAVGILVFLHDLADNDRAVVAGIDRDLTRRRLDCLPDDVDAVLLVLIFSAQARQSLNRVLARGR